LGVIGPLGAGYASEDVLFQRSQIGFALNRAEVGSLKVVVGNVVRFRD
jgi:hypothetical protein